MVGQRLVASTRPRYDLPGMADPLAFRNARLAFSLDSRTGSLLSFGNHRRQFIAPGGEIRPLFTLRFRDGDGNNIDLSSLQAGGSRFVGAHKGGSAERTLHYEKLGRLRVNVVVTVRCDADEALTYWTLALDNDTDLLLEWIDFPGVVVPNDLVATGGDSRILWPGMEGCLIEDVSRRERGWMPYRPMDYPSKGWEGYFPGPTPTQLMAYYGLAGGLYFAAHDPVGHVKSIEYHAVDGGIRLEYRLFPGAPGRGSYKMPFEMALGVFEGDWYDAASIYRDWREKSDATKFVSITSNPRVPAWLADSPVVVTYPVRGTQDTGDMTPNAFYPYTEALPQLSRLSKRFDSPVLALLMHWEGTAPWAPPYVWPPFGGEADFRKFIDALHESGNLAGVYCSGIGWTQTSNLVPYDRSKEFEQQNLASIMCLSPKGELPNSLICNGPSAQRWGYDMCPSQQFVHNVVEGEVAKILDAQVDYIQYFDQNLGGASYLCYAKDHGHPPAPGLWQVHAMQQLAARLGEMAARAARPAIIGCESAAAEPYLPHLLFNDLRYEIDFFMGTPVPLYSFLFHESTCNFMGNQNTSTVTIDSSRSPDHVLQRLAMAFNAGDVLTVVMKGGGHINWDWGTPWSEPEPQQEPILQFIRHLNAWRRGAGRAFLFGGRMEKPFPLANVATVPGTVPIHLRLGGRIDLPILLTNRWRNADGRTAQFIVNPTRTVQQAVLMLDEREHPKAKVGTDPEGKLEAVRMKAGRIELEIQPLSAAMIML